MHDTVWLIYDGECPICSPTANAIKIKKAAGHLELVDARDAAHPIVEQIKSQKINLDAGMVVKVHGQFYHGAAALNFLALIGTESDRFNRLNVLLFRNKYVAALCYPLLRLVRNMLLWIQGVKKINP